MRIALASLVVLGTLSAACRRDVPAAEPPATRRAVSDSVRVVPLLADTVPVGDLTPERSFDLRVPGARDSLRALLRRERALWERGRPRGYRFQLRVSCFCPGQQGWLLMEVRDGQPLRAWNAAGKAVPITDWNTFSIDGLFDHLVRTVDRDASVQIRFDRQWHVPAHVSTAMRPGPDAWSVIEVRGLTALR